MQGRFAPENVIREARLNLSAPLLRLHRPAACDAEAQIAINRVGVDRNWIVDAWTIVEDIDAGGIAEHFIVGNQAVVGSHVDTDLPVAEDCI